MEDKIKKALNGGPKSLRQLKQDLSNASVESQDIEDKVLNKILQKLRKKGEIKAVKGRWVLTSTKICPKCDGKGWV